MYEIMQKITKIMFLKGGLPLFSCVSEGKSCFSIKIHNTVARTSQLLIFEKEFPKNLCILYLGDIVLQSW